MITEIADKWVAKAIRQKMRKEIECDLFATSNKSPLRRKSLSVLFLPTFLCIGTQFNSNSVPHWQ